MDRRNKKRNVADENIKTAVSFESQTGTERKKKLPILSMKNEVKQQILKRYSKKIENFINWLSVPSWCRALSAFQKKSADDLQNAIRDDLDQKTVYRTMRCLSSLGLDPLPTKKQLQVILSISGCSDLAFLWFLMEWLYQDSESDTLNINKQLIMSSIAHLDMNITLQELDRILPPGQAPKTELIRKNTNKLPRKGIKSTKYRKENVLPYFQKLPDPKLRRTNYIGTQKQRVAILEPSQYEFNDPSSPTENEHRRWFQDYENGNRDSREKVCKNFNVNTIDDVHSEITSSSHHENIKCLRNSFASLLEEPNHKPLKKSLLCDTEKPCREYYATNENCRVLANEAKFSLNATKTVIKSSSAPHICNTSDCASSDILLIKESSSSDMDFCFLLQESNSVDFHDTKPNYFKMCHGQSPYKFNYNEIYNIKHNDGNCNCNGNCNGNGNGSGNSNSNGNVHNNRNGLKLESLFSKAFDSQQFTLQNCMQIISKAASDCNELVNDAIRITHAKTEIEERKVEKEVVDYGLDYYDPNDDELMDRMLEDAFGIMKKDHRFVFAAIPTAHRYPLVREWIRVRYGKTYNKKFLTEYFQKSLPIFEALTKVGLLMKLPSSADIGKSLKTDYSCRDYILQKSRYMRKEYYKRINKALLAQSRIVFFAMCPFQYGNGPLSDTIFAYTPAHKHQCHHFRPWKLKECRGQKKANS